VTKCIEKGNRKLPPIPKSRTFWRQAEGERPERERGEQQRLQIPTVLSSSLSLQK